MSKIQPSLISRWRSVRAKVGLNLFNYLGVILVVSGVLGLRGVLFTPMILGMMNNLSSPGWLTPVYWFALLIGLSFISISLLNRSKNTTSKSQGISAYWKNLLLWFLIASPFFYMSIVYRLSLDFFQDEVVSIYRHILPSVRNALFWYPAPNNHIFTNAISGIYLRIIGVRDLREVFLYPAILRSLYLAASAATIWVLGRLAYRMLGRWAAILAVALLTTTIAFLNFGSQVRGYGPSLLFSTLLIFWLFRHREQPELRSAFWTAGLAAALFYTIPSNGYFLLAACLFLIMDGLRALQSGQARRISWQREAFVILHPSLTLAAMLIAGVAAATVLYLPIISQVMGNKFVVSLGLFQGTVFSRALPILIKGFLSERVLLFILALIGLLLGWVQAIRTKDTKRLYFVNFNLVVLVLPFLISFVRGDDPFERTFLVGLVPFTLLAAFGLTTLTNLLNNSEQAVRFQALLMATIVIYAQFIFVSQFSINQQRILQDLTEEDIQQVEFHDDIMGASFFLEHYHVLPSVEAVLEEYGRGFSEETKILLDTENTEQVWMMKVYLEAFDLPFEEVAELSDFDGEEAYVILSFPQRGQQSMRASLPDLQCEVISPVMSIYQAMHCNSSGTK